MKSGFTSAFTAIFPTLSLLFQYMLVIQTARPNVLPIILPVIRRQIRYRRNALALTELHTFFVAPVETNAITIFIELFA